VISVSAAQQCHGVSLWLRTPLIQCMYGLMLSMVSSGCMYLASAYAWTNTPASVVWLRDEEPGVHGLSVLGFGHCWSCVLID
jgi:hypothetical protein